MERVHAKPRKDWVETVKAQGLIFPETPKGDSVVPYWNETAWYDFTTPEIEVLESATEELWGMCLDAAHKMATDLTDQRLGLPVGSLALVNESLDRLDPWVYARFDLRYLFADEDGDGLPDVKMLELNGDTPTGLVETGVAQWRWLEDVLPDADQWNSLHERLLDRWTALREAGTFPEDTVHFLYMPDDSGEEEMTVYYMQDLAIQAGLRTRHHPITEVGWVDGVGFVDVDGQPIGAAFKLYPWESMLTEEYGRVFTEHHEERPVRWIEPVWKLLMSTKAILPVLWEMNPNHRLLLPAYFDEPHDMAEWIRKPLHGREGDNITVGNMLGDTTEYNPEGGYGAEGFVYQQYAELPEFEGNYAAIGSWVVDGQAAGMLVRESDGPITDYYSRVCPHVISDGLNPDDEQRKAWLAERTGPETERIVQGARQEHVKASEPLHGKVTA